jgi:hypothetical protein
MARKLDYGQCKVVVTDATGQDVGTAGAEVPQLVDGLGVGAFPTASNLWVREEPPTEAKPAVLVFDYGKPVKVAALAHYFYVPGSRDQRWQDWLSGPSAFNEVRLSTSDDGVTWTERAHHSDIPTECPQLLTIESPESARYLKLEVLSMAPGAGKLRSYQMETYLDRAPKSLSAPGRVVRRGFPVRSAVEPAGPELEGVLKLSPDRTLIDFELPAPGLADPAAGRLEIRVDNRPVSWDALKKGMATASVGGTALDLDASFVKAGLLLKFTWHGEVKYPAPKLEIVVRPASPAAEWCVPEYFYSKAEIPESPVTIATATMPTAVSIVGDGKTVFTLVPDTDRSWVGVQADAATTAFPLGSESPQVLLLASAGDWFSGFERAVVDVFDFDEPDQFSPVSEAIPDLCRYLLDSPLWSEKHQMMRSFPGVDFFYIFYSLPYAIPALTYWEELSGDPSVGEKIDHIVRFTLDRRIPEGPMKGAIFSEYADRDVAARGEIPYEHPPYYAWTAGYQHEDLIGMDQGLNRWITAHTMGSVLWSITHLWRCRGRISDEVLSGARDVADWMVRLQKDDGSWSYAYNEAGETTSPMSDSGTIWNVWGLWRFGQLTGDARYSDAAERGFDYFKQTFTENHLYRGYWEDVYGHGKTVLNTAQGYESSIAALAFAEIGDIEAMKSSSRDSLRYICTRVLECRDKWTSYGGACEQQGWAPATYIAPTFGYAAHVAWRKTGDDTIRRFSCLAKTIGWWQDSCGAAVWIQDATYQQPIESMRTKGGRRQFWAIWDSAQKVAFVVPWLVEEVNRRTGGRMRLSSESLAGTDDLGDPIAARVFRGRVKAKSGQVNWLGLKPTSPGRESEYRLALLNHAGATEVTVKSEFASLPTSCRLYDPEGRVREGRFAVKDGEVVVRIPKRSLMILVWTHTN